MHIFNMVNPQIVLFLLMFIGYFAKKRGIVSPDVRNSLSSLIIDIVLPCNIIDSFMNEKISAKILHNSLLILMISCAARLLTVAASRFLYRRTSKAEQIILRYATINSNATFIGLPVIGNLYGTTGVHRRNSLTIPDR